MIMVAKAQGGTVVEQKRREMYLILVQLSLIRTEQIQHSKVTFLLIEGSNFQYLYIIPNYLLLTFQIISAQESLQKQVSIIRISIF